MESVIATREEVQNFLSTNTGCGYGDGTGSGEGYGDTDGCGEGYGCGYGYGDGDGGGTGICGCEGFGDGEGEGNGYIIGTGYGYGDCDMQALNGNVVDNVDSLPTIITQVSGNFAKGCIVNKDLTLESCYIAKVGNFFAHGKTLKDAVTDAEKKKGKRMSIEGRIKRFVEIFGSLNSEHTGKEYYDWHHILTNSCQMGRDKFCEAHDIDLSKKYTVKYFLDITKNSYGSNIIKLVREAYENMEE